jgi:hypothetical protein
MISLTPPQLTLLRPAAPPPAYVIEAYRAARLSPNPTRFVRKL